MTGRRREADHLTQFRGGKARVLLKGLEKFAIKVVQHGRFYADYRRYCKIILRKIRKFKKNPHLWGLNIFV